MNTAHATFLRNQRGRAIARNVALALTFVAATGVGASARAADGCLVLLCLAAPSWSSIGQCIDPVRSVLRDLALGHPFPSCDMSGDGNHGSNRVASVPDFCPPQYAHEQDSNDNVIYSCDYSGAVEIDVGGALWSRTWWNPAGDSVTEFSDAAKAQLGSWDTRFEDDYARWLAAQPVAQPPAAPIGD